jgi:hypothetical protein
LTALTAPQQRDNQSPDNGRRTDGCDRDRLFPGRLHRVVGNRAASKCEFVTGNPVVAGRYPVRGWTL